MDLRSKLIVFFIILLPVVFGNLVHDMMKVIHLKEHQDDTCSVELSNRYIDRCDANPTNGEVSDGTICTFTTSDSTVETFVCEQGYLIYVNHAGTEMLTVHNERHKRFGWFVAAAVGGVLLGAAACYALCPKEKRVIERIVVNKPPTITCPNDITRTAEKLANEISVSWNDPEASDPENKIKDVTITRGSVSGSKFGEGTHTIVYTVTDEHGNSASCSFNIKIIVIYCYYGSELYLENGKALCATPALYGRSCSLQCNNGFQLSNNSPLMCEKDGANGKWVSANAISCNRKKCDLPKSVCNGDFLCTNENFFESVCFVACKDGYSVEVPGMIKCDGDTWIGMDTVSRCKDVRPPVINCPSNIHIFADEYGFAVVNWDEPTAIDNSDSDTCDSDPGLTVQQTSGNAKKTAFKTGYHLIEYEASDKSGNTQTCQFSVIVEELLCKPLVVEDKFLLVRCPSGFSLGASCSFSCFLSYEMVGSPNATCLRDQSEETKAYWEWSNEGNIETFCEKLKCPDLPAPAGGALACSSAVGNEICVMSCSDKHLVPKGTSTEYVCNDEQVWIQGIPPNCTDRVHPSNAILPGDLFYYYSGDCSNVTVQEGIKQNFVQVMESLQSGDGWDNICPNYCTTDGVTVTCGPANGRRRRRSSSSNRLIFKRSTSEITISFKLKFQWQTTKNLWGNDDDIQLLSSYIDTKVSDGSFDVPGTSTGSVTYGWIEMSCPKGLEPKYDEDAKCVGCSPGKYLKGSECLECEKGTYQNMEYQINCTRCPAGQSTEGTGSTSFQDCKDKCSPGSYSTTGIEPCTPCPMGQYQPEFEATSCKVCQLNTYTSSIGSTNETDCHVTDLAFESDDSELMLSPLQNAVNSFTIGFWMKCSKSNDTVLSISLGNLNFTIGDELTYSIPSHMHFKRVKDYLDLLVWTHIAIVLEGSTKTVQVYGNGDILANFVQVVVLQETDIMATSEGCRLTIHSKIHGGCILSGFYMVGENLSQDLIKGQTQECTSSLAGAIYNMDAVYRANKTGIQLPRTTCDAVDECQSNPCGVGNICINKVGGFSCNCTRGYGGPTCQTPPDFCIRNDCHEGSSCLSKFDNYTCICSEDFTGRFCEHEIVHGNWGPWVNTSECSLSCNGGTRTRKRFCNNPEPDMFGSDCIGSDTSISNCNEQKCPECKPSYTIKGYKNELNCSTTGDSISCVVTCQSGYSFIRDYFPLDEYFCGPETLYEWPTRPPPCAPVDHPLAISTSTTVQYQVDCSSEESFELSLSSSINQLQCVGNGTCDVSTSVSGCSNSNRKRRSLTNVQVTINLFSDLSSLGELKLDDFFANNIVSPALYTMIRTYTDMDQSIYQMNTTDVLTIDDKGVLYEADLSSLSFTSNVTCPDGKVEEDLMCVECPSGTYWNDGFCVMCSVGYYQSQSGQLHCVKCQPSFTTDFVGSQSEDACNVPAYSTENSVSNTTESAQNEDKIEKGDKKFIIIAVVVGVIVSSILVVITVIVKKNLNRNKRLTYLGSTKSLQSVVSDRKIYPEINENIIGGEENMESRYVSIPPMSGKM